MPNAILLDLAPLRGSRDFRLLFGSQLIGVFGGQVVLVAIPFQVFALTRSSFQVGAVSLAQLVPLVLGALWGGSLGDGRGGRAVLVVTSSALALTSGALAFNATLSRPSLAAVYLISAAAAGLGGVVSTTCSAAVPALVGEKDLTAAYASMQVVDQVGMVVAPLLSGVALAAVGPSWVYALASLLFLSAAATLARLSSAVRSAKSTPEGRTSILDGVRYLKGRKVLQAAYLIDGSAMAFGLPRALFPAMAATVFHGGGGVLGCLYAAPGVGAFMGAATTGWLTRVRRQGWAVVVAVCVWGSAIVVFGLVDQLWLALALLCVAGWADVISAVLRTTIVQRSVSERFRGRISGMQIAVVEGGPRLGDLEAGAVATLTSIEFAVVSGGLACVAGALLVAGVFPGFRTFGPDDGSISPGPDRSGSRPDET